MEVAVADAVAATGAPQLHLASRHAMRVYGPDSYALLFLFVLFHGRLSKTLCCWRLVRRSTMSLIAPAVVMLAVWTSLVDGKLSTSRMSPRVVETVQGKLRAVLVTRPELGVPPVEVYLGVQYASTLGAELRFMPPTASIEKWDGVRVALKHRPVCPQRLPDVDRSTTDASPRRRLQHLRRLLPFIEKQSEDCLNLNIFVPLTGTSMSMRDTSNVLNTLQGGPKSEPQMLCT